MELTFDDNKMQFYPTYNTIRDLFLSVVEKIAQSLPNVQSIKGFINAENEMIDTSVSTDFIKKAGERLKESLEFYMIEPREHLNSYIEKYSFIVDGTAEKRIDTFIADTTKEFDDYIIEIQFFQDIIAQIQRELSVIEFDMIFLMCDDLKIALIRITKEHMNRLIEVLNRSHREESHKICEEYEQIKAKALSKPDTTEELNEMVKYIETTKEDGVIKLETQIKELRRHMAYLLDTHLFDKVDIDLNTEVIMWPTNISPIFDQNEELMNETRLSYENLLNHQREKLLIELDKLHKRIDEFSDYGELDQMKQYVDDTKNVSKRINDANRLIEWIQNEELQFKLPKSEFPLVDTIKSQLDPYSRLFNTVLKWQRNEKKWVDGAFLDLHAESIEGEVEDFWKETYKIQKLFISQVKKRKLELQAKLGDKRKSKSKCYSVRTTFFFNLSYLYNWIAKIVCF